MTATVSAPRALPRATAACSRFPERPAMRPPCRRRPLLHAGTPYRTDIHADPGYAGAGLRRTALRLRDAGACARPCAAGERRGPGRAARYCRRNLPAGAGSQGLLLTVRLQFGDGIDIAER